MTNSLKYYQELEASFIEALQTYDPRNEQGVVSSSVHTFLHKKTAGKVAVYQEGYFARLTQALTHTLLEHATLVMGEEYVQMLLLDYFKAHPPVARQIDGSIDSLASFIESTPEWQEYGYVADLVRYCLLRWDVLRAENPPAHIDSSQDLSQAYLRSYTRLLVSPYPVFSLIQAASAESEEDTFVPEGAEAILCFKSDPTTFEMLVCPQPFVPFIQSMINGSSLLAAIESVAESVDEQQMQTFVAQLRAKQAL